MTQIICTLIPLMCMTAFIPFLQSKIPQKFAKWLRWSVFCIYVLGNLYFTLLSRVPASAQYLELRPFRTYGKLIENTTEQAVVTAFAALFLDKTQPIKGIILNILLYYPLGYLLPIVFPKLKPRQVILVGCLCSIATEATQYIFKMGWCVTDDVIHNTLGAAVGVWVSYTQGKQFKRKETSK